MTSKMALIEPFDLQSLLVYTFAGNWYIFMAVAMLFFSGMAAKFRMNFYTFSAIVILFGVFMNAYAPWYITTVLVLGGIIMYLVMGRIGK